MFLISRFSPYNSFQKKIFFLFPDTSYFHLKEITCKQLLRSILFQLQFRFIFSIIPLPKLISDQWHFLFSNVNFCLLFLLVNFFYVLSLFSPSKSLNVSLKLYRDLFYITKNPTRKLLNLHVNKLISKKIFWLYANFLRHNNFVFLFLFRLFPLWIQEQSNKKVLSQLFFLK